MAWKKEKLDEVVTVVLRLWVEVCECEWRRGLRVWSSIEVLTQGQARPLFKIVLERSVSSSAMLLKCIESFLSKKSRKSGKKSYCCNGKEASIGFLLLVSCR